MHAWLWCHTLQLLVITEHVYLILSATTFYGSSHPDQEVYHLVYTDPGVKLQVSMKNELMHDIGVGFPKSIAEVPMIIHCPFSADEQLTNDTTSPRQCDKFWQYGHPW